MTDQTGGITAALIAFQAALPNVGKTSTAQYGQYADLSDVSGVLLPRLAANGIAYTCTLTRVTDTEFLLVAQLRHVSGEVIASEWPVPRTNPQTMGSSLTYGRRYLLLAMTGVHPAGEDDDAQLATKEHAKLERDTIKTPRKATRAKTTRGQDDEWATAPPEARTGMITPAQLRMMGALMGERGMTERVAALDFVATVIGREISTRNDLTVDEAGKVIGALQDPRPVVDIDTGEVLL